MRSRNRLHKSKLEDFTKYLEARGWVKSAANESECEVLRMKHPERKGVLLVHMKLDAKEHLTTWGISDELLTQYFMERGYR